MPRSVELPIPSNWQDFEDFCHDLFAAEWGDREAQKYGRSGQKQHGVDVYGRRDGRWQAVQCKRKQRFPESKLTEAQVRHEVTETYAFSRKRSRPLETLVIATTAQPDTAIQDLAAELTDEHAEEEDEKKRFRVVVYGWAELCDMLQKHPAVYDVWRRELGPAPERGEINSGVLPVPNLPPHFLPRPEDLAPLKNALIEGGQEKLGVTGSGRHLVGVQGMGGIGKTVLAAAACHEPEVKTAFAEGIVWITLGQEPNLLRLQQDLARALGAGNTLLGSVAEGKRVLKDELEARSMLLVLDDVWELEHASALDVIGASSRLLVTTRNREILVGLGAEEIQLDVLAPRQSRVLLALWAREAPDALPATADEVAKACGHLPLALAMIGAMVRLRPTVWEDALERLRRADLDRIRRRFPDYPYPDLLRALEVSVEALDPQDRQRYVELAVFPEDASVPAAAVEVLWSVAGLDDIDARELIDRLVARSLAQLDEKGRVSLHDLQGDYVRRQAGDPRVLHEQLLEGYRSRSPEGLARGEPDGYFHDHVAAHLARAERRDELRELLSDYRWLEAKLRVSDLQALLADYEQLEASDPLRRVGQALRLAAHVVVKTPEELPSQLVGRLLDEKGHEPIAQLLEDAQRQGARRGWLRPLRRSLVAPGGSLLLTLECHTDAIWSLVVLADGRVVSASDDWTLRVWDPKTGILRPNLVGHTAEVTCVVELADGRVVSASQDHTVRVWDPNTGALLRTLKGHTAEILAVAVLADGRVVSASADCTLRVWDPDTGALAQTLEGHTEGVRAVATLPDDRVVSASEDRTLRVWDPDSSKSLRVLKGHTRLVSAVAVLANGQMVSASIDGTLRVWDPDAGKSLQTLETGGDSVVKVVILAEGHILSVSTDPIPPCVRVVVASPETMIQGAGDDSNETVPCIAVVAECA